MQRVYERIFVLYPRGQRTGGPEALHQLVDSLRRQGADASLVPLESTRHAPRVDAYEHYDAPEAAIVDRPESLVIAPESAVHRLSALNHAGTACWWLSIDYSVPFYSRQEYADRAFARRIGVAHRAWEPNRLASTYRHLLARTFRRRELRPMHHLAQSEYARSFLRIEADVDAALVSDYIPRAIIDAELSTATERRRAVAFNPKKASWVPDLLGPHLADVEWIPLTGMTPEGVAHALHSSAAYFDPGFHPGRDRMPREAALLGAVSVLARRGAGAFWADTPLPWQHKVAVTDVFAADAAAALETVLAAPAQAAAEQAQYRRWIDGDRERFDSEVAGVLLDGRWADDTPILPAR
ncbi:hypothetical protein [Microbacterium sp. cf332]|uniref:hypothetical protein n=1 Tax=Microbacterium sp. cf332 TaxID=1761804 RepID=UPI000889B8A5|nr:hypothetical protein [Microbacterium sp. cf332]SDQ79678.1 hypothetical protein SAMN04487847_2525 [Microbacterium sp. cf332]